MNVAADTAVVHVEAKRRPPAAVLAAVVRNPILAVPPEAFHERLVTARLNGRHRVYITAPALIREALVANAASLAKGDDVRRVLVPALGEGLITANGPHWRWQRGAAAPLFRHDSLQRFLPTMLDAAGRTAARWTPGTTQDVGKEMMRTTFEIIVDTLLDGLDGIDVARVEEGITAYLRPTGWMFALGLLNAPAWTPYPGRRRALASAGYLRAAVSATVARRRAGAPGGALLDRLLEAADPETDRRFSDAEIADNLLTFITAGHETTALALAWALHLLARHPDHAATARAEIEAVTGGGPVRPEHVPALGYVRQVVNEAMRLFPPVPIISRLVERPFRLASLDVEAGAYLYVPIYALHRHALLWDAPERFDPARFSPENEAARDRYAFMPFGAGPRICIGAAFATMEAVAILATLLRAGTLESLSAITPNPVMRLTLRPGAPLRMRWRPAAITAPA